jgi:indolepyruvate ferredoxin oxidoreductase beta subunit
MKYSLVIAGVGGQGGLTLSRILADAAVRTGHSVRTGETLGMAQRGGSVLSFIRIGQHVRSPLLSPGTADALIGLEVVEAVRASPFLMQGGLTLVDPIMKATLTTLTQREKYPELGFLMEKLKESGGDVHVVHACAESSKLGFPESANTMMLGAFCACTDILPVDAVRESVVEVLGPRCEKPLKAFKRGEEMIRNVADLSRRPVLQ